MNPAEIVIGEIQCQHHFQVFPVLGQNITANRLPEGSVNSTPQIDPLTIGDAPFFSAIIRFLIS